MQAIPKIAEFSVGKMEWRRLSNPSRRRAAFVMLALSAVLLLAQGIELSHSHDNLQSRLDCHLCLKHNSKGKVLLNTGFTVAPLATAVFILANEAEQPFLSLPPAKSRAPPHISVS